MQFLIGTIPLLILMSMLVVVWRYHIRQATADSPAKIVALIALSRWGFLVGAPILVGASILFSRTHEGERFVMVFIIVVAVFVAYLLGVLILNVLLNNILFRLFVEGVELVDTLAKTKVRSYVCGLFAPLHRFLFGFRNVTLRDVIARVCPG